MKAKEMKVPIISSMGAGNKLDPSAFRVAEYLQDKDVSTCEGYAP